MLIMLVVSISLIIFCETPFYLHSSSQYDQLFKCLRYIGWWNDRERNGNRISNFFMHQDIHNKLNILDQEDNVRPTEGAWSNICYKNVLKQTVAYVFILSIFFFNYSISSVVTYGVAIHNIYVDNIIAESGEMLGSIMALLVIKRIERNYAVKVTCTACVIVSLMLLFVQLLNKDSDRVNTIFEVTLTMVMKTIFWVSVVISFVYGCEIFPTKLRGFALGLGIFTANLFSQFSEQFCDFARSLGIAPIILSTVLCLISVMLTFMLPETIGKKLSN